MTNKQPIIQLLGLAQRARELTTGENLALKQIRQGKAKFVFIARDAGAASAKKLTDKCHFYHVPVSQSLTRQEISQAIGQTRTVVVVNQTGFAKKFQQLITNLNEGE
ncbi:L7Ae/L30e/S12e/Gadd45 family ribosomal protein [Limosilactobacillus caecicola]|uniref:L7Ae/L30e/S12e/Gadd45 family ribosomal protein n=1 Tax=Limosilactobacillus caecicola TaxID=2941332 RepID=UPI0020412C0C|nr:ribosomal L7Ae/L30e/S12e/Gadd45 family protein [Limosilactobacillus caecicola]